VKTNTEIEHGKPQQNAASEPTRRGRPLGVYVHFPWCISKCPYCDFFSIGNRAGIDHEVYATAVINELRQRHEALQPAGLESIYFGGGTPSLWDAAQVQRVIEQVLDVFGAREGAVEITLECNPSSFDLRKCSHWKSAGVNRLSLGVQSLHDESLKYLGRAHDSRTAMAALRTALESEIAQVCADVIFGLPGRTVADCISEARQLPLAELAHVSAYALTIEPNTPFGVLARTGRLELAPDELITDSFIALHEELERVGFEHYEISNYARPGCRSRHNSGYWQGRDYLGLGVAAWGTVSLRDNGVIAEAKNRHLRYRNTTSVGRYVQAFGRGANPVLWDLQPSGIVTEHEVIDETVALSERFLLGLRTSEGVDLELLSAQFDIDTWLSSRRRTLDKLQSRGRISMDGSHLRIPFPMWYLADGTISELL
jgi:putative oxygen-independent coproporphyrinogen III oxidase